MGDFLGGVFKLAVGVLLVAHIVMFAKHQELNPCRAAVHSVIVEGCSEVDGKKRCSQNMAALKKNQFGERLMKAASKRLAKERGILQCYKIGVFGGV